MENERSNKQIDLKAIIESAPDLYLVIDKNFNIIEVSNNYLTATMVTRDDIINKHIFDVFPDNPNDPNATGVTNLKLSLEKVLKNKAPDSMAVQKYDMRRPIAEGNEFEERYWSSVNTPVLDENNEVKYIIHRVEDVTEFIKLREIDSQQQKIAEKLLARTGQMELEIYRRAQEIQETNRQLQLAIEKAEMLTQRAEADNQAKSNFLATMSHELRTALNGVIGMTELLLDTALSPQQLEFAETIKMSGEALLTVVNDVLDYSKIESGHLQLGNSEFNIQSVVDQAVEIIIGQAYRKRIEIGAFIEPDVPRWCSGDPVRIRQVLNNLICNAIKFTKHGEISLWIKLIEKIDHDITLLFEVSDTGIGIEPQLMTDLFHPFSRGNSALSSQHGGTGLGLCISKRLIELMKGSIEVESYPGKGSKFTFSIKLKEGAQPFQTPFKVIPELVNEHMLCIDDSEINRRVIQRMLASWEIQCDVTDDAAKGLSMLMRASESSHPYKIVFIDDCMPNINGIQLVKLIREIKEIANTTVIILVSLGFSFDKERLSNLSVSTNLSKPISPGKLYATLNKVLQNNFEKIPSELNNEITHFNIKANILLAEDNFVNQQICLRILHKIGLDADVVTSGLEAINAYKNKPYDLILMDCQMPQMDGYTATEQIRQIEQNSNIHVPIIAMTAHALKGDREKCIKAGMDDYISKPINIKLLTEIIGKWIAEKRIT